MYHITHGPMQIDTAHSRKDYVSQQRTDRGQMLMKYFLALMAIITVAFSQASFSNEKTGNEHLTGLPWQIDILPGGDTQVFGIILGRTTLGEAIERLGDEDMELAIIASPYETGALEAYYNHYSAGPITGKLFLIMDIAPDELSRWRERAYRDGGTRKHYLHPDDLAAAYRAPVRVINFMPSFNLDEEIVRARFGAPAGIFQAHEQQQHWLYPDKGLDLILNTESKEVLQYMSPGEFSTYRDQLQQLPSAGE